jgi:hypothetical protein
MPDMPYETKLQDGWADKVAALDWAPWTRGPVQLGWVASGPCPRCGHLLAVYQRRVLGALPSDDAVVKAACNCTESHPGRPESRVQGCGQEARIPLSQWTGTR